MKPFYFCIDESNDCTGNGPTLQEAYNDCCERGGGYSLNDCTFFSAEVVAVELTLTTTIKRKK